MSNENLEPRIYEVGYHILPIVGESDLDAEVDLMRSAITQVGGELIKEGAPRLIDLAYPMSKVIDNKRNDFTKGYFGWIKFELTPDQVKTIKEHLDNQRTILRFILITTVREDTFIESQLEAQEANRLANEVVEE